MTILQIIAIVASGLIYGAVAAAVLPYAFNGVTY